MVKWPETYKLLHKAGYLDRQIAAAARKRREVVNNVRNDRYPFNHEPGLAGALALRDLFRCAMEQGELTADDAAMCGMDKLL